MSARIAPMPSPAVLATALGRRILAWQPVVTGETLVLAASVFFVLTANLSFWHAAMGPETRWQALPPLFALLLGLHGLLLGALLVGRWARPILGVLLFVTACATYYMQSFGVYLDADMLRNVLHTDWAESRELLTPSLGLHLLVHAVAPGALLLRVKLVRRPFVKAALARGGFLLGMGILVAGAGIVSFKELSSLLRNHHEVRYLVTPANYLYGLGHMAFSSPALQDRPLLPVAADAYMAAHAATRKPRLLVLVVGETVRARNWGLNGYDRQTTPRLAALDVVNFPDTRACGSSTEASLPCMFSPWGREDYNEDRIRSHQSLLHVLQRVGVDVLWRDNQSGCKGVCRELRFESTAASGSTAPCDGTRCLDEILLEGLLPPGAPVDRLVVLHMLGNHGPSYFQRYPPAFERYVPTCRTAELGRCSDAQIVNAYDNAVLYTDHVLAQAIDRLGDTSAYDTALIYVSDHGESLGEGGMYLHGMPYAIAPREQLQVPMVMWFAPEFASATGLDMRCLRRRAGQPASHDNLFSTVLGIFDVQTTARSPDHDLLAGCRAAGNGSHDSDIFPT